MEGILFGQQEASLQKRDRTWRRWTAYTKSVGFGDDPFLDGLSSAGSIVVSIGFLHSLRHNAYGGGGDKATLAQGTIRETAGHLASAFRSHQRPSPVHDHNAPNKWHPRIERILKAWKTLDPPVKRQPAITPKHLRYLFTAALTEQDRTLADLAIGAWSFAMRSCEYLAVSGSRTTKLLCLRNIVFRDKDNKEISHDDPDLSSRAFSVTITFETQKNQKKFESRSHTRSSDPILCPVVRWISVIQRILRTDPKANSNTAVCRFPSVKGGLLTGKHLFKHLQLTCKAGGGIDDFGYHPKDIGTHSIRSGAAMALHIQKVDVPRIMMLGR